MMYVEAAQVCYYLILRKMRYAQCVMTIIHIVAVPAFWYPCLRQAGSIRPQLSSV